jgi:hypothetical protein
MEKGVPVRKVARFDIARILILATLAYVIIDKGKVRE